MEPKPGIKTTEIIALVAGLLTAIIPAVTGLLPPDSVWIGILGAIGAACAYIIGRSWVKASTVRANALVAIAKNSGVKDPTS